MNLFVCCFLALTGLGALGVEEHVKEGRRIVWREEFDGDSLDQSKWCFRREMFAGDCEYVQDSDTVQVRDGFLRLRVVKSRNPAKRCRLPLGLTTHDGMSWRYGYVEMRARVPYRRGAWPSFWMLSTAEYRQAACKAEVDIFESFAWTNGVIPTLHKWIGRTHAQLGEGYGKGSRWFQFSQPETLNDEFHVYGLEWTPRELVFYIDGKRYYSCPIDNAHDFNAKTIEGMDCFHDFMYLIVNNEVFTPCHDMCPKGRELVGEKDLPIDYTIDWFRLWQNPDTEEIRLGHPKDFH